MQDIQQSLYQKLKSAGWDAPLKGFVLSRDFLRILQVLKSESEEGLKITPRIGQIFRNFEECPYEKLKLVMIFNSPYQFLYEDIPVADGIPLSVSNTRKYRDVLRYMSEEIQRTVYPRHAYNCPVDLKCWSNQGVLMIDCALTTTVGRHGTHYMLWRPFLVYLLDVLNWHHPGLIYSSFGKKAQEFSRLLGDNCYKLNCFHPSAAHAENLPQWDSGDIFNRINGILESCGKSKVIW